MNQHQSQPFGGPRGAVNLVNFLAHTGAVSVEVFLHTRFGQRYIGVQGAAVLLLIPGFTMLFPHDDPRPLLRFLAAYIVACAIARADMMRRQRRGDREHSRYNGWPRILPISWARREQAVKEIFEPTLTAVAGALMLACSKPLGLYWMFAALCLASSNRMIRAVEEQKLCDMQDALFEQRQDIERLRQVQDRWP